MVRSNGVEEGLSQRGALASAVCTWDDTEATLRRLSASASFGTNATTHWIVQTEIVSYAQGQMSNERRVRYEKRDWAIEVEVLNGRATEQISIAVRRWREEQDGTGFSLNCDSALKISLALRGVARWAVRDSRRLLFEWVWDRTRIYLVQMDAALTIGGVNPKGLLPSSVERITPAPLKVFREASAEHKGKFRKLENAALYETLGYSMPPFYVLDDLKEIGSLLHEGLLSDRLLSDLRELTKRPLVLRTDGADLPRDKREMLPRSQELRTSDAAADWLVGRFRSTIQQLGLVDSDLRSLVTTSYRRSPPLGRGLTGQALGENEALWGIPESLYWHSHDTFEVSVETASLSAPKDRDVVYSVRSRERFKGTFIAPDADGAWIHHQTKVPHDWAPSIESKEWLSEIAHTTRRICEHLGKPVEVMWFVATHLSASSHRVLPWYHSVPANIDFPISAPRKENQKRLRSTSYAIRGTGQICK